MKKLFKRTITMLLALIMVFTMVMPAMAAEAEDDAAAATKLTSSQVKVITPTGVKAASYSYSRIKVSWNKIDGADGYEVYRATSKSGKYEKVYSTGNPDKLYYINTGRITGKTYWYKIRGYKKISGKTYYTRYSAATSTYARPNKVKGLTVYGCPYSLVKVTLDWQPVSGAAGYEQQVNVRRDGAWTGWKSAFHDEDGDKYKFSTWDSLLAIAKKQFPSGTVETQVNGKWKKVSLEEYTSIAIGKTQAWLKIVQDESVYKFRVRAYRKVNGKKVYGPWSDEFTLKETLDLDEIMAELKEYTIKYAAKVFPEFRYKENTEGRTPENNNYNIDGVLGYSSMYARQEDVIVHYKNRIKRYIDLGYDDARGFLYARKVCPGEQEGLIYNITNEIHYSFWMLY